MFLTYFTLTVPLSTQEHQKIGTGKLSGIPDEILGGSWGGEGLLNCDGLVFHIGGS